MCEEGYCGNQDRGESVRKSLAMQKKDDIFGILQRFEVHLRFGLHHGRLDGAVVDSA